MQFLFLFLTPYSIAVSKLGRLEKVLYLIKMTNTETGNSILIKANSILSNKHPLTYNKYTLTKSWFC